MLETLRTLTEARTKTDLVSFEMISGRVRTKKRFALFRPRGNFFLITSNKLENCESAPVINFFIFFFVHFRVLFDFLTKFNPLRTSEVILLPPQGFRPEAKARGGIHGSLRVYIANVLTVRIYDLYTRKNLDLLEKGRMESLGYDVKAENARRRYGYCDVTITGGYVRVNFICFLKDFFSFYSDEVAYPRVVAVES